jgi:hypothetical protein
MVGSTFSFEERLRAAFAQMKCGLLAVEALEGLRCRRIIDTACAYYKDARLCLSVHVS